LGWADEQTFEFLSHAEWAWHSRQGETDAAGRLTFWQNTLVALWTPAGQGAFFRFILMIDRTSRIFSLALQSLDPFRLHTQ
jgi:hypothetical protein